MANKKRAKSNLWLYPSISGVAYSKAEKIAQKGEKMFYQYALRYRYKTYGAKYIGCPLSYDWITIVAMKFLHGLLILSVV